MKKPTEPRIGFSEFKAICRAVTTYDDLNLLINHIAEHICRSFEVRGCSIFLFDEREKQFFRVSSHGVSEEYLKKGAVPVDDKNSSLFAAGKPVIIENMLDDPRVLYPEAAKKEGLVSMLSVPIIYRKFLLGILRIYHSEPWVIHKDDLDSFCLIGLQLGLVVENNGLRNFFEQVHHAMQSIPLRMLSNISSDEW